MRTVLYTGCYLNGEDVLGNNRIERNIRYVNYYLPIKEDLGFERIYLLDNGSQYNNVTNFLDKIDQSLVIFNSMENLQSAGPNTYPYCWRSVYFFKELFAQGYEKIILIDSDGFVLSKRLADYIKNLKSGWITMWCKLWDFPEASLQIICKDALPLLNNFTRIDYTRRFGVQLELMLPFTHIADEFNCDRFGEIGERGAEISADMDYYGQAVSHLEFKPFWR